MSLGRGMSVTRVSDTSAARFIVVHRQVVFRKIPSTKAEMLYVAKKGNIISGVLQHFDDHPWIQVSEETCKDCSIVGGQAWVLMHGASVGLGDLLRPVHEEVEFLEELLWRLADERGDRVRPLVFVIHEAGLRTGAQFLAAVEAKQGRTALQGLISKRGLDTGFEVPDRFVDFLKVAIEDSRLALKGYPQSLSQTKARILFTAPHSVPLCREGHKAHQPEAHTQRLARDFAQVVGGAFLTWAQQEEKRALDYYRRMGEPDPTNHDPNFTHVDVLDDRPWTRNLREVRELFGLGRPCLHVDLHGCKDPTAAGGSHLIVGLRAMEFAGHHGVEELRSLLQKAFALALRGVSVNVRPQRQLTGALQDGWCTLTQQSLSQAGGAWTCAVQLEMSRALRQALMRDKELRTLTAQAINFAWILASRDTADPAATLHALQYWTARCKAFYNKRAGQGTLLGLEGAEAEANKASEVIEVDEEDEDRDEVVGESTANSEARATPLEGPVSALEADMAAIARSLPKRDDSCSTTSSPSPTPVQLLVDWLRMASDVMPILQPHQRYHIVGTWCGFKPQAMDWNGTHFVHDLSIGAAGWESFQILLEGDWRRTLYPSVPFAGPYDHHILLGPDQKGHGKNWSIGLPNPEPGEKNAAKLGQRYRVVLRVNHGGVAQEVFWEFLGVEEPNCKAGGFESPPLAIGLEPKLAEGAAVEEGPNVQVVVYIDRSLDLQVSFAFPRGTTVAELKEELAHMDPTGQTKPQDFAVKLSGPTSGGEPLSDAVVLNSLHAELEVCTPTC